MTCEELRLYFKDPLRPDAELRVETEHIVDCADCARFVDTQRQLRSGLRRLREALPEFPAKLDANVIANYRRDVDRPTVPNSARWRRRTAILCMAGAVVATVLVAVVVSSLRPRAASLISGAQRSEPAATSPSMAPNPTVNLSDSGKVGGSHPARGRRWMLPVAAPQTSPAPGFRGLMYCDKLSCGGVMDVIRVQLPSAGIGLEPASTAGGSTVTADVLVGPDGIARGIRIVE